MSYCCSKFQEMLDWPITNVPQTEVEPLSVESSSVDVPNAQSPARVVTEPIRTASTTSEMKFWPKKSSFKHRAENDMRTKAKRSKTWPWKKNKQSAELLMASDAQDTIETVRRKIHPPLAVTREPSADSFLSQQAESSEPNISLKATRSEVWPWAAASSATNQQKEPNQTAGTYGRVLRQACQQGVQAPSRHQIGVYSKKALPALPVVRAGSPTVQSQVEQVLAQSDVPAATASTHQPPTGREMVSALESEEAAQQASQSLQRSELVTQEFLKQSRNHIVSQRAPMVVPTWVNRAVVRAEIDQAVRNQQRILARRN